MLTTQEKLKIYDLRDKKISQTEISKRLGISSGTIAAFLARYPVNNIMLNCLYCGKEFKPPLGNRIKRYCCGKCRQLHKNSKRKNDPSYKKAFVCEECGVVFIASKYKKRRFCSRECFQSFESRRWNKANEGK